MNDLALFLSAAVGFTASIMVVVAAVAAVKRAVSRQHEARRAHVAGAAPSDLRTGTCRVAP